MNNDALELDLNSVNQDALLEGGPSDIPIEQRERPVGIEDGKIKLQHYGGYEYFERTDEDTGEVDGGSR